MDSSEQIEVLAACADRTQQVVLDPKDAEADALALQVLAHPELDLVGLHCRLEATDDAIGAAKLRRMIAEMAWLRRQHGVLPTRLSLAHLNVGECAEPWVLRRVAEAIYEVVGDACARHRYPRPALTPTPSKGALLPA